MPAKHLARHLGNARIVLSFVILVLLIMSFAVRAIGYTGPFRQPIMVLPPTLQVPVEPSSPVPSAVPPPSVAPVPSAIRGEIVEQVRATSTPGPATTRKPTSTPVVRNDLVGTLGVRASWEQGYVAEVRVVNNGSGPIAWRLTASHSGQENLQLLAVWGASGEQQGTALVFHGGILAAGASVTFGYQASKSGSGNAKPSSCSVVGGSCRLG